EALQYLERQAGLQREVLLAPVPPAAASGRLQQEHVVAVEVRADAAAVRGYADHDVVEPGVRNEAELLHQGAGGIAVDVDTLHQQGPARFAGLRQAGERPVFHVPRLALAPDQARLDVVAARQLLDGGDGQRRPEARNGLRDQEWPALPIAAHELR